MLKIGDKGIIQKTICEADVELFAKLTGDFNPIHISEEAAKNSVFKERIAHGMLAAGLISTVIGMHVPGPGAIYLEQNCKFLKPVKFGDTLTVESSISKILNREKGILQLENNIYNQRGECIIDGSSVVKVDPDQLEKGAGE